MKRSKHNLGHYKLTTTDMGWLTPIGLTEVLPGDSFQHSTSLLLRMSPMVAPVMHPIDVRVHHFFVPNRILWDGWEDFITGGPDGNNAESPPTVEYDSATSSNRNILDYYGVPPVDGLTVNALPLYGYNLIYNEYFRDQDIMTERPFTNQSPQPIAWEKDYITSARPWEQKGDDVTIPVLGTAQLESDGGPMLWTDENGDGPWRMFASQGAGNEYVHNDAPGSNDPVHYQSGLQVNFDGATSVDVNDFRKAFALQRYQEARAKYGSRYTEYLRYLGINPPDSRLQRPEYLGGGRQTVSISEVLQTAPENVAAAGTPEPRNSTEYGVGDMYGHGIAAMRSNKYRRFFNEHGYVHTMLSVRPKAMYVQGLDRHWLKKDKEDYFQKELHYIGQQPIYNAEVYADNTGLDNDVFGYQDRYIEYKRQLSNVSGEFRSLLNYWHLGREFTERPVLNQDFVRCQPGKRIFAEQTQNSLWIMAQHRLVARRIVPKSDASRIL